MCLYPRFIKNRRYVPNKKNGGVPPSCKDWRMLYVPVGCGNCIECRKQKAREWKVRLNEELKVYPENVYFVTLSFSPAGLVEVGNYMRKKLAKANITDLECNAVAGQALRLFLERYRKKFKRSIRHWFVTELGDQFTERIHLHGLIWTEHIEDIEFIWHYGNIYIGDFVTSQTVNYIVKYILKIPEKHLTFRPQIFCSAGLGSSYVNSFSFKQNKFAGRETKEYYRLPSGDKINLPIYYRNKRYSEDERNLLWLHKLDDKVIYINGVPHPIRNKEELDMLEHVRQVAREDNIRLGFGDLSDKWKKEDYNITLKMLNHIE